MNEYERPTPGFAPVVLPRKDGRRTALTHAEHGGLSEADGAHNGTISAARTSSMRTFGTGSNNPDSCLDSHDDSTERGELLATAPTRKQPAFTISHGVHMRKRAWLLALHKYRAFHCVHSRRECAILCRCPSGGSHTRCDSRQGRTFVIEEDEEVSAFGSGLIGWKSSSHASRRMPHIAQLVTVEPSHLPGIWEAVSTRRAMALGCRAIGGRRRAGRVVNSVPVP